MRAILVWLALMLAPTFADGRPPPGPEPDPAIAAWFHSLRRDSDNFPCCDVSDCRKVDEYKDENGSYIVTAKREDFVVDPIDAQDWKDHFGDVDSTQMIVPRGNITIRTDNPTGSAILCYSVRVNLIFCFVPWDYKG